MIYLLNFCFFVIQHTVQCKCFFLPIERVTCLKKKMFPRRRWWTQCLLWALLYCWQALLPKRRPLYCLQPEAAVISSPDQSRILHLPARMGSAGVNLHWSAKSSLDVEDLLANVLCIDLYADQLQMGGKSKADHASLMPPRGCTRRSWCRRGFCAPHRRWCWDQRCVCGVPRGRAGEGKQWTLMTWSLFPCSPPEASRPSCRAVWQSCLEQTGYQAGKTNWRWS